MSTLHRIQTLTHALRQAAQDHNWPAVMNVDTRIAGLLTDIRGEVLDGPARQALALLKQTHQQACDYCQGQSEILAARMRQATRNREGASAYALFMDDEGMR